VILGFRGRNGAGPQRDESWATIVSELDKLWPHGERANHDKFFESVEGLASEVGDPTIKETIEKAKRQFKLAKELVANPPEILMRDIPDSVLDGRLGEICMSRMHRFPIAYAWPALLAVASALISERGPNVRTNLYSALVGPIHSGKSQAIDSATQSLGLRGPQLMETVAGSAEALIRETAGAAGNPRLFCPDELGHTLEKLKIERSSFSFVLNSAFYKTNFKVLMGKKETSQFNCHLSILGGLVEERFADLFNASTTAGLYDRFMFGLCPGNFRFDYRPFEGPSEITRQVAVRIHPQVWEAKSAWESNDPQSNSRVFEIAVRTATICSSFDGKTLLNVDDLKPHFELAKYQHRIRAILKPNPGENFEGQLAHKFLNYLTRLKGGYASCRDMYRQTHAYDKGPSTADRALDILIANGDVEETKVGKKRLVRIALESESGDIPGEEIA
jgi:hypothetical protein